MMQQHAVCSLFHATTCSLLMLIGEMLGMVKLQMRKP